MAANAIVIVDEDERARTRTRLSGLTVEVGRHWIAHPTMRFRDETRGTRRVMFAVSHNKTVGADQIITAKCKIPGCVHPGHLRLETTALAGVRKRRSHCVHGHPFSVANTVWAAGRFSRRRQCKVCNLRRDQEYAARRRAARQT